MVPQELKIANLASPVLGLVAYLAPPLRSPFEEIPALENDPAPTGIESDLRTAALSISIATVAPILATGSPIASLSTSTHERSFAPDQSLMSAKVLCSPPDPWCLFWANIPTSDLTREFFLWRFTWEDLVDETSWLLKEPTGLSQCRLTVQAQVFGDTARRGDSDGAAKDASDFSEGKR
jgi:hypothetical protein